VYDDLYVLEPTEPRRENNLVNAPAVEDIADHPMWQRLREAILRALMPFAEARAAVVSALSKALAVSSP
jgi:hypothetical protein